MKNIFIIVLCVFFVHLLAVSQNNIDTKEGTNLLSTHSKTNSNTVKNDMFYEQNTSSLILKRDSLYGRPTIGILQKTQSYHYLNYLNYCKTGLWVWPAIVSENSTQYSHDADSSDRDGEIELKVNIPNINPIKDTCNLTKITWQKKISANQINYKELFIEAKTEVDFDLSVRKLIRYDDGMELMTLTSNLYGVARNYSDVSYIGYWDKPWMDKHSEFDTIPDVYGVMTFLFDPIKNKKQILIIKNVDFDFEKKATFKRLSFIGLRRKKHGERLFIDSKDLNQYILDRNYYEIKISFQGVKGRSLRIPVRNNKIDIKKVKPNWCTLLLQ
jgi:hypothetical protein